MSLTCKTCNEFKALERNGNCSSCNRAARKKPKEKKVYALRQYSKKKEKANRKKLKTYKELGETRVCETCGRNDLPISRSHLIPVSQRPKLEAVAENIVLECYGQSDSCHYIWENGQWEDKAMLNNFDERMIRIKELDESYFNQIISKATWANIGKKYPVN